jgi:hypothetical protein
MAHQSDDKFHTEQQNSEDKILKKKKIGAME